MNNFHDCLFDDVIIAAFGNGSGHDGTEKSLSIAQKVNWKFMDMVKIKKGLIVDSGAADHVIPIGWLLMFLVVKSIGSIRGLHYVAADGTRFPNVGQQLIKFMTLDETWTERSSTRRVTSLFSMRTTPTSCTRRRRGSSR